jgi:hypothetical protein
VHAPSWSRTIGCAVLLSLGFVLAFLAWSAIGFDSSGWSRVTGAVLDGSISRVLILQVATFFAACFAVHLMLTLAAVGLAYATERAIDSPARDRVKIMVLWAFTLIIVSTFWSAGRFTSTRVAAWYGPAARIDLGPFSLSAWIGLVLTVVTVSIVARAIGRSIGHIRIRRTVAIGIVAIAAVASAVAVAGRSSSTAVVSRSARPNVVIIGIDSLRLDELNGSRAGVLSNVDAFLSGAARFEDAITPMARTFPSWVSILTGRHPVETNALLNLTGREHIDDRDTLADRLGRQGYRTIYAIDEVRFSNIDASYGFKEVVTPTIGAADFLIGEIGDVPLVNLLADSPAGRILFPQLHANRAVAKTYRPEAFVGLLKREIELDEQPSLLVVHLTTPHWPYYWADTMTPGDSLSSREKVNSMYRRGLEAADWQFGQIMSWLQSEGILDNAVVVLLSDHGQAMMRDGDSLLESVVDRPMNPSTTSRVGHGTSVLSPIQYQVLLSFRGYGRASQLTASSLQDAPASLEDVAPTIYDLLGLDSPGYVTGRSLAGLVSGTDMQLAGDVSRTRFTETEFALPQTMDADISPELQPELVAEQSAEYYRINPDSGYVELRSERMREVLAYKERAAIQGDWLLASLPTRSGDQTFILAKRSGGVARRVTAADADPRTHELWRALRARYGESIQALPAQAPAATRRAAGGATISATQSPASSPDI